MGVVWPLVHYCVSLLCCCDVPGAHHTALFQRSAGHACVFPLELHFIAFPASALQQAVKMGAGSDLSSLGVKTSENPDGNRACVSRLGFAC